MWWLPGKRCILWRVRPVLGQRAQEVDSGWQRLRGRRNGRTEGKLKGGREVREPSAFDVAFIFIMPPLAAISVAAAAPKPKPKAAPKQLSMAPFLKEN